MILPCRRFLVTQTVKVTVRESDRDSVEQRLADYLYNLPSLDLRHFLVVDVVDKAALTEIVNLSTACYSLTRPC